MHTLLADTRTFPGGEVFPRPMTVETNTGGSTQAIIRASLTSSDQVMSLLMLNDALEREGFFNGRESILQIGYFPYARQDREANHGESLSVKVMAGLINNMCFDQVQILDPHSDVTPAVLRECVVIPAYAPVLSRTDLPELFKNAILVSPDAGAEKKTLAFAKAVGNEQEILRAGKTRCTETGRITGTWVAPYDYGHEFDAAQDFVFLDDICDGGRTFMELRKAVFAAAKGKVRSFHLHATHGIFSKGLECLLGLDGFDSISTTDSLPQKQHPNLTVIPAFPHTD